MTDEEIKKIAEKYARDKYLTTGVNPNFIEPMVIDLLTTYCKK